MLQRLLYTPAEACRMLNISRTKLYAEISAGRLRALKNGSRTFFHHDELSRYVAELRPVA